MLMTQLARAMQRQIVQPILKAKMAHVVVVAVAVDVAVASQVLQTQMRIQLPQTFPKKPKAKMMAPAHTVAAAVDAQLEMA
jgi:hypothetical protein